MSRIADSAGTTMQQVRAAADEVGQTAVKLNDRVSSFLAAMTADKAASQGAGAPKRAARG